MRRSSALAITGMGCLCAAGTNVPEVLTSLFSGIRNPKPAQRFQISHPLTYPVFEISGDLLGSHHFGPGYNLTSIMALIAVEEALADAGLSREKLAGQKVGVCLGTTVGSTLNNEPFYREFLEGKSPDTSPIDRFIANNPASMIAEWFKLSGPCQTVVNACSSGTDAIGIGACWIKNGECDLVIAGGADELCRTTCNGFISLMIMDTDPCRPFDVSRKGLNLGEGAGVLILESEKSASRRKVGIKGRVLSYATACDAYHLTAPRPDGGGLKRALSEALHRGGVRARDLAFVNAHGTGTPDNDRVEGLVLSEMLPAVPFLSTKGYTGHTLGAAGGIEAVITLACLEANRVPASIGFSYPDSEVCLVPVRENSSISGAAAVSQSLAFGGNNSVLVLGR
jgi:3-oxoacyl-[acyl-carrier-protein] synthase II